MNTNKKLISMMGPVASRSGYGDRFRDVVKGVIAQYGDTHDIKIIPTRWGNTPLNSLNEETDTDILSRIFLENKLPQQPDVHIQCTIPPEFNPIGKYNIGFTAGIETDFCDATWIEGCNKMDRIVVSSEHAKGVFERTKYNAVDKNTNQPAGVLQLQKPVDVLFEGVDLNVFGRTHETSTEMVDTIDDIPEDFCFLTVGHWLNGNLGADRKDIGMTIKLFMEVFKNLDTKPALILKTGAVFSETERRELNEKIDSIKNTIQGADSLPNVYLLHGDLTQQELNTLYVHPKVKAMLSLTKGEGFGRPMLEFTTSGKPVIATNWSGHVDFLTSGHNILLDGELKPVDGSAIWKGVINEGFKWFQVDYNKAGQTIRDVFNNYGMYEKRAKGTISYTKKNFSKDLMNEKLSGLLKSAMENVPQPQALKLPKLKKVGTQEPPKISLPKLKKVTD